MDLNYLFHRHQISLMRADEAGCSEARWAHEQLAQSYARLIEQNRADRPQGPARRPANLAIRSFPSL